MHKKALAESKTRRRSTRVSVVPEELLGIIVRKPSMDSVPFLMWDISNGGVGIWVAADLEEGEEVVITLGKPYLLSIEGTVKWSTKTERQDCFRVGISVEGKEEQDKLTTLYEKYSKIYSKVEL